MNSLNPNITQRRVRTMRNLYSQISGYGKYVPEKVLTNYELEKMVNTSHEWIMQRTGIAERRIAAEDETSATMAVAAARQALEVAQLTPADLDLIIVSTSSPDYHVPAVSSTFFRIASSDFREGSSSRILLISSFLK